MNARRLLLYCGLLLGLAVIGLVLTIGGLQACAPPPLPGDELWTWRQDFATALDLVFRAGSVGCFTGDAAGRLALLLGPRTALVLLVVLVLVLLWETLGRALRLAWFRWRGGHVLLAGTADDLAGLMRRQGRFGGTVFLAPDRGAAVDLARARPFAEITSAGIPRALARRLAHLGAGSAALVAAGTRNDLVNVDIADAALAGPGRGELLLRLESGAVRALSSHALRQRAERHGRRLVVVSLSHLQTRRGMAAAMSGRYTLDGAPRVHIALCGTGPGLQEVTMEVVRQGFGLETERPLVSILRTGAADFTAGALERLQASEAAAIEASTAFAAITGGLDKSISSIVLDHPPLLAVHCVGDTPAEAEALALRWEEALLRLRQPVPPIIAYAADDRPLGTTGMIRTAAAPDLAAASDVARLMDQRAMAVHAMFLAAQRADRGEHFGTAPAEVEWAQLPETYRDDNRNVADQMDYKLARVRLLSRPGPAVAPLAAGEIEVLAGLAHARWLAAKALTGWRFGPVRDNQQLLHPDMIPYAELSEGAKQKDRDEVASLAPMAALAGEALLRERRVALTAPLAGSALQRFADNLLASPKAQVPVAVLPLDDAGMLGVAATLAGRGIAIEAVLGEGSFALWRSEAEAPRLASILRAAWRIHVAQGRTARDALAERAGEVGNGEGAIDALV
ncbi:MAG TPA: RyR domain-containing protein [Devosia sp.]|nr:RyR domain-containing protein [Devosia sp.]